MKNTFSLFFTQTVQQINTDNSMGSWVQVEYNSLHEVHTSGDGGLIFNCSNDLKKIAGVEITELVSENDEDPMAILPYMFSWASELDPIYIRNFIIEGKGQLRIPLFSGQIIDESFQNGLIKITVPQGVNQLDSSTAITVDTEIPLGVVEKAIRDYSLEIGTPIKEAKATEEYYEKFTDTSTIIDYPIKYKDGLNYSKWHYELTIRDREIVTTKKEERRVIKLATVDLPITVDYKVYNGIKLRANTEVLYDNELDRFNYYDADSLNTLDNYKLVVQNVPKGTTFIQYYNQTGELISESWTAPRRGYLPASILGVKERMNRVRLAEIGWALLALIAQKDRILIHLVLTELTYIWENYIDNKPNSPYGLPTIVPRISNTSVSCTIDLERSAYDNAWCGYCICLAIKYLQDGKIKSVYELPKGFMNLVVSMARLVSSLIDPIDGLSYKGYTENTYLIEEIDLLASITVDLFLSEVLSLDYVEYFHNINVRLRLGLNKVYQNRKGYTDLTEGLDAITKLMVLLHMQMWAARFEYEDIPTYIESELKKQLDTNPVVTYYETPIISYLLEVYKDRYPLLASTVYDSLQLIGTSSMINTAEGNLVPNSIKGISEAELMFSSLEILKLSDFNLDYKQPYKIYAEESYLYRTQCYTEAQRMTPYGYRWFKKVNSTAYKSRYGAVLYGGVNSALEYGNLYNKTRIGLDIDRVQGEELESYLWMHGIIKKIGQSDNYLRRLLKVYITNRSGSKSSINLRLSELYTKTLFDLVANVLPEALVHPTTRERRNIKKANDLFLAFEESSTWLEVHQNAYQQDLLQEVTWEDYAGVINLVVYEALPSITIATKTIIGAGVELRVTNIIHSSAYTSSYSSSIQLI